MDVSPYDREARLFALLREAFETHRPGEWSPELEDQILALLADGYGEGMTDDEILHEWWAEEPGADDAS